MVGYYTIIIFTFIPIKIQYIKHKHWDYSRNLEIIKTPSPENLINQKIDMGNCLIKDLEDIHCKNIPKSPAIFTIMDTLWYYYSEQFNQTNGPSGMLNESLEKIIDY